MADSFIMDPNYLDGYPSFGRNFTEPNFTSVNLMATYKYEVTDYYPSFGRPFNTFDINCPFLMKIRPDVLDGYPGYKDIQWFKPPYPKLMMTMEPERCDGMPSYRMITDNYAAFKNASSLEEIVIPQSVKSIIDYAFYNTNLKSVKIARDCLYGEHSFPVDCIINYY